MKNLETFYVEVEKALDWENGFLNCEGNVVTSIDDAEKFTSREEAEDAAASFNIAYGRNGRIYATLNK
jgi:hypothetical protein